ncbi:MAG: FtsW/RodA/SpoVE family cell cycle protein, partial [Gemmatimonadetes bacterium]|nr:FtsW/RodA/SpoVE family cell cycle protein [Gemmatimonadota bacterium]
MITLPRRTKAAPPAAQPPVTPRDRRPAAPRPAAAAPARAEATLEARALVALTAVAFCFGLVEMYSASSFIARGENLPGHYYALKQIWAALAGVILASFLARLDYRRYRLWAWPMLIRVVNMLIVVIMPG